MPSRLILDKRRYVFTVCVGKSKGFLRRIKVWYWNWRLDRMSEGEILKMFYEMTGKEDDDDFFITKTTGCAD